MFFKRLIPLSLVVLSIIFAGCSQQQITEHVGIGTDFDGGGGIAGFNDHSEALNVTIELVRRGYSEEDISKIWGANLLRVWREVEK